MIEHPFILLQPSSITCVTNFTLAKNWDKENVSWVVRGAKYFKKGTLQPGMKMIMP